MSLQCKRLTLLAQRTFGHFSIRQPLITVVSLLVGRSLNAFVNLVFVGDGGWFVVADIAVKSFEFQLVVIYAPSNVGERHSFYRRLDPFLDDPKRIILVGDWNAILDPKIDKAGWGASGSDRCESSLIDLMASTIWLTGFVWIIQGRRCGQSSIARPLSVSGPTWTEC